MEIATLALLVVAAISVVMAVRRRKDAINIYPLKSTKPTQDIKLEDALSKHLKLVNTPDKPS